MELYKDKLITVIVPEQPATIGHVSIRIEKECEEVTEDDMAHALSASSFLSNVLFEQGGAQGTNIIFSDMKGLRIDVLTRKENDDMSFQWTPQQIGQDELGKIAEKIKDKCDYINIKKESPIQIIKKEKSVAIEQEDEPLETKKTINYLLKKLDRIP